MSLSENIKDYALNLGYSKVGITSAESFPEYIKDLKDRHEMYSFYIDSSNQTTFQGANPRNIMPNAKSIIVAIYDIFKESFPPKLVDKIGRFYQARCYVPLPQHIMASRHRLIREFLEENGCEVDSQMTVPERPVASRAGTTTYGKNTFSFVDGVGSFILINAFVVDCELQYDEPTHVVNCPPDCTICIDNCPTGSLYKPLKMDPRRCIGFNHWVTQEKIHQPYGIGGHILPKIREKMGTWIHGCDICQEVCPRNKKRLNAKLPQNGFLARLAHDFELTKVLNLTDEFYTKRVQPLMYNYIRHKKYFQRNAAIALGNTGDTTFIPALDRAMQDPEALVRGYAAWALGKIGGNKARQVLEASLLREADDYAMKEIQAALEIA